MNLSRFAFFAVWGFAGLAALGSGSEVRAQYNSTVQTISPDGTVTTTSSDGTVQTITPDGATTTVKYAKGQVVPLTTLGKALDKVFWDSSQRGPLIAVAPEVVRPAWQTANQRPQIGPDGNFTSVKPPTPPEPTTDGRYRPAEIADFFGQRIVRLKGLSVVAPIEMVVLNTKLGKPDYFADLRRDQKQRLLQASLTAAQWKLLGSDQGLGANDLSGNQRDLFLSTLPDPMRIRKVRIGGASPDQQTVTLAGDQRNTVRLRLSRTTRYSVPMEGETGFRYPLRSEADGTEYGYLINSYEENSRDKLYGQQIRTNVPNRLKPQQIDFASPSLQKAIPLTGLKTVGDLMERIRTTTRVSIFADGRVTDRALWIRADETQSVLASEALQALCWSLTGAVRAVSNNKGDTVFILTEDAEGAGSRLAHLQDWARAAQQHFYTAQAELQQSIAKQQPIQYIGFAPGDTNALTEKASKTIEESWKTTMGRYEGAMMPLSDLSPQQQELVKQGIAAYDKNSFSFNGEHRNLVDNGSVSVSVQIRTSLLVPGVGEVRGSGMDLDSLLPPATRFDNNPARVPPKVADTVRIPETMPLGGVLCVSPATDDEAVKAVRSARERGLKQVWLVLPVSPALAEDNKAAMSKAKSLLAAASAEAQKGKPALQILAAVRLFSVPSSSVAELKGADQGIIDIAVTGNRPTEAAQNRVAVYTAAESDPSLPRYYLQSTRDWVAPETPGLAARLRNQLTEICKLPGIAGLALLDTAPPGYCMPASGPSYGVSDNIIPVGYTASNRVAFIRTAGYDPIDIFSPSFMGNVNVSLSFFRDESQNRFMYESAAQTGQKVSSASAWNSFRSEIVSKVFADMYAPLTASLPKRDGGFPIYVQSLDTTTGGNAWFSRWEKSDALPRRDHIAANEASSPYLTARKASPVSLIEMGYRDTPVMPSRPSFAPPEIPVDPVVQFARSINFLLTSKKGAWSGLVLNFSEVPVDKAVEMIGGVVPSDKSDKKTPAGRTR